MTDLEREEQLEAAIDVTQEGNQYIEPGEVHNGRVAAIVQLQGMLNCMRGFDAVCMGA